MMVIPFSFLPSSFLTSFLPLPQSRLRFVLSSFRYPFFSHSRYPPEPFVRLIQSAR
jgi:hypothetical protein